MPKVLNIDPITGKNKGGRPRKIPKVVEGFVGIKDPIRFEAFIWYHLRHYLKHPIEKFHRELIGLIRNQRVAIAAPRSFAKSTYYSFFYPLYLALEQKGVSILLVSATGALAEAWLAKIRLELEGNLSLKRFYKEQNEKGKWASDELHLANGSVIMAKGAEKQIRGFRPDVIVCDDLETDEMVVSIDRRKKFDHWFWTSLIGTLKSDGQMIVVGTLLHPESFLADLVNKGRSDWVTKFYAAVMNGEALWPDEWSLEKLEKRKLEMGSYEFEQEYMNNPLPDDLRKFQKKWIQYFEQEPKGCTYFTTIDPAIEVTSANDFSAVLTCAVDSDSNIFVVEAIVKRLLPNELIDIIFSTYKKWNSAVIGIESVGFQKMLKYEIDQQKKSRNLYPVITELSSGGKRKALRIEALQPLFEAGKVFFKKDQEELETELLRFPSPRCHDDAIDALAYMLNIIRPSQKDVVTVNPDCFLATIERRRKNRSGEAWGNFNLRGDW